MNINNEGLAKSTLILMGFFYLLFFSACEKDEQSSDSETTVGSTTIIFDNFDSNDQALVTYTDGSSQTVNFSRGILNFTASVTGDKIIKSITPKDHGSILIGRKEGDSIHLNYFNNMLHLRTPVNGLIPIGSYDEFQLINSNNETLGASYKLEADLDLMNENWKPIGNLQGNDKDLFRGNFDGGGHELKNLKINSSLSFVGLFSGADPDVMVKINNLTIRSGSVNVSGSTNTFIGCVIGVALKGSITNCYNYATIHASEASVYYVGGVVGIVGYIHNCHNYGEIIVSGSSEGIGGVVGKHEPIDELSMILSNCSNNGAITADKGIVGGIVGLGSMIVDCRNDGAITKALDFNDSSPSTGGIAGVGSVSGSTNTGVIKGFVWVGGIAGTLTAAPSGMAQPNNNTNNGAVSGTIGVGGIVGSCKYSNDGGFENFTNTGQVTGIESTGGIVGYPNSPKLFIVNARNSGTVKGDGNYVGGILGGKQSGSGIVLTHCSNNGNVTGGSYVGGIAGVGVIQESSNQGKVVAQGDYVAGIVASGFGINSHNDGVVNGQANVGGITGDGSSKNCYNTAAVIGIGNNVGGVAGSGEVYMSYNTGAISGYNYVGGVVGLHSDNNTAIEGIKGCYNMGAVTGNGTVGGIAGYKAGDDFSACFNKGNVTGLSRVGGIVGNFYAVSGYGILYCYNTGNILGTQNAIGGIVGEFTGQSGVIRQSYNIGSVIGVTNVGGIAGIVSAIDGGNSGTNFWKDISNDGANYAFGSHSSNSGSILFSTVSWPTTGYGWIIGPTAWQSFGSWNGGESIYPKLYFE